MCDWNTCPVFLIDVESVHNLGVISIFFKFIVEMMQATLLYCLSFIELLFINSFQNACIVFCLFFSFIEWLRNFFISDPSFLLRKFFMSRVEWCWRWRIQLRAYCLYMANYGECHSNSNNIQRNRDQKCFDRMSSQWCSNSKSSFSVPFTHIKP